MPKTLTKNELKNEIKATKKIIEILKKYSRDIIKRDINVGDIIVFNNELCFVSEKGKNTVLKFYSEEKKSIRLYKFLTKKAPLNSYSVFVDGASLMKDLMGEELADDYSKETQVIKKGNYVSFEMDGKTHYGAVEKSGKKVRVVMKNLGEVEAHKSKFTVIETPVMKIHDALKDWSCVSYKENKQMSEETICFSTVVKNKNKKMFEASNRGHGGEMDVRHAVMETNPYDAYKELEKAIKISALAVLTEEEIKDKSLFFDVVETYILWYNIFRKMHISWEDYIINY